MSDKSCLGKPVDGGTTSTERLAPKHYSTFHSSTFFTPSVRSSFLMSGTKTRRQQKNITRKSRSYSSPASTQSSPPSYVLPPASSVPRPKDVLDLVLELDPASALQVLDKEGHPLREELRVLRMLDALTLHGERILTMSKDSRDVKASLLGRIGTWMHDLLTFHETTKPSASSSLQLYRMQCWRVQADAFRGVVSDWNLHLSTNTPDGTNAHRGIYLATLRRAFLAYHLLGVVELTALRLLLPYWPVIFGPEDAGKAKGVVDEIAHMALEMSRKISPEELKRVLGKSKWKPEDIERIGGLVLGPRCVRGRSGDALRLYKLLLSANVKVSVDIEAQLIRALVQDGQTQVAAPILAEIERRRQSSSANLPLLEAGLALFAKQGDTEKVESYSRAIQRVQPRLRSLQISWILQAYAEADRMETVTELFQKFFNSDTGRRPTPAHYMSVLRAHQIRGDVEGWIHWFERARMDGVPMKIDMLNAKLSLLADRGDVEGIEMTLREMDAHKERGDLITYTILVGMFARRRDPVSAEQTVRRAVSEGIEPDGRLVSALIQAYVRAESWDGLIRIFDYLENLPGRSPSPRYSAPVLEAVLKAHVGMGAPFSTVSDIFRKKMQRNGLRPTSRAYSLVIQSACDANRLDDARSLLRELDERSHDHKTGLVLDWRAPTILMLAYLRLGQKKRAREVFEGMRKRGIPVNSTVLAKIIQSIIDEDTSNCLEEAERFLDHFMTDPFETAWMEDPRASVSPIQAVLVPVMQAYADRRMPSKVRELLEQIIQVGGRVTLTPFNILLHAYRRVNDVEMAKKIWEEIFRKAMADGKDAIVREITRSDSDKTPQHMRNALVIPLSIIIDALSTAGEYRDIVAIWKGVDEAGFGFDAGNWNHFILALIRAGDVDQAFRAVSEASLEAATYSAVPSSPKSVVDRTLLPNLGTKDTGTDTSRVASPLGTTRRRAQAVSLLKDMEETSIWRSIGAQDNRFGLTMRVLQSHTEQRSSWRPFATTMTALKQVLERLNNGYMLLPVQPGEASGMLASYNPPEAARLLAHIRENYPQVMKTVLRSRPTWGPDRPRKAWRRGPSVMP
ncbi:hypothetical protein FRB94_000146 [Tulasnella sp. JGI-2019a]|nr:hypothetical protein FRB94_000146 [Tulasnella sp. JGI-2019a]